MRFLRRTINTYRLYRRLGVWRLTALGEAITHASKIRYLDKAAVDEDIRRTIEQWPKRRDDEFQAQTGPDGHEVIRGEAPYDPTRGDQEMGE